jgi:type IV pilus assembly protein PilV
MALSNQLNRSQGFSMVEVLVTLVLVCIGVLGMVAMQSRTIAYTQDAVQRNIAAMLADDLMELLRADLGNVLGSDGQPVSSSNYYKATGADFPDAADDCSSLSGTNAAQRLGCWAERAKAALPGAESLMNDEFYISKTGSAIEIQLAWAVKSGECLDPDSDDNEVCRYRLRAEL